ncbi:MAG: ABC transporter permease [Aquabacterium sp.]|uniref:ABC transporter permease n=1 Tax=Aquabacterium sp. TaxID=1872578 RepID=UPI0025BF4BA6|nr:ABC transporter permease [Aquabacterium sp.]MBI3382584.1 ABC transporter permease [Aquabacterium sp.]
MRAIPLSYVMRNLWVRRVTTVLTAGGMSLVVFVFATVLMMSEGIKETMVATGQPDNVIVLRKGSGTEINSAILRAQATNLEALPGIMTDSQGIRQVARESVVLNNLPKRDSEDTANVTMRGTSAVGINIRPQVTLVQGRMFRPGTTEIIVGQSVAKGFANISLGNTLSMAGREWTIVGIFDAKRSGFDSEIWGDSDQVMQSFRRTVYSAIVFKLTSIEAFAPIAKAIADDPQLQLDVKLEQRFYAEQSEGMTKFITLLGLSLSVIFSIGAIVGAMITMFAAVASRIGEIGTLRALGFRREAVLIAFLGEALGLALVGGLLGLAGASVMQTVNISTLNMTTFSELAFRFKLTWVVGIETMSFALLMGFLGGFVPAWRAGQLSIIECLRQA